MTGLSAKLFEVTIAGGAPQLIRAVSCSAARYDRYRDLSDVWSISFREFLKLVHVRAAHVPPPPPRDPAMTDEWRELARHALGLPNAAFRSYRNRFVTGAGTDGDAWSGMVAAGLAKKDSGGRLPFGGADFYWLTPRGAQSALDLGETLCPEDFPRAGGEHAPAI